MQSAYILIGHGSGGRLSRELVKDIFLRHLGNATLNRLSDASGINTPGDRLAFTTDSYVIDPVFFPGGNIGQLAVSGTVNDLAVSGAIPQYLSAGFIIEEGFPLADLEKIVASMAREARQSGVEIITGDTKVVKRGQCDKLFINTSGIGRIPDDRVHLQEMSDIEPGDKLIVSGFLGDHAVAVLAARENLRLDENIVTDATPLNGLIDTLLDPAPAIRFMRDITRGGLATVLAEICENQYFGIEIIESNVPVRQPVKAVCELYGFDPLYLANEGKVILIVKQEHANAILQRMKAHPLGRDAAIIGEITASPGRAVMQSVVGGKRIVDMLSGEMLPRIC